MPSPTISYLICSMALIMLIFVMPFFYSIAISNISVNMVQRELKEIADYVSNTLANLYFLANSTSFISANLSKELPYLPSYVEDSIYMLKIDQEDGNASKITACLRDRSWISADSWLLPGLKVGSENSVEITGRTVVAGCTRTASGVYVWIKYG